MGNFGVKHCPLISIETKRISEEAKVPITFPSSQLVLLLLVKTVVPVLQTIEGTHLNVSVRKVLSEDFAKQVRGHARRSMNRTCLTQVSLRPSVLTYLQFLFIVMWEIWGVETGHGQLL